MKKITYKSLLSQKKMKPFTCLTAYTKSLAKILDGKVDIILIGDSLGTALYGMKNTQSITLDMMKNHGKAVVNNVKKSLNLQIPFTMGWAIHMTLTLHPMVLLLPRHLHY